MTRSSSQNDEKIFNAPSIIVGFVGVFIVVHALREFLSPEFSKRVLLYLAFSPARFWAPDAVFGLPPGWAKVSGIWTLFTHVFVHGSWGHLTFNSLWMLAMGSVVARRLGVVRFVLFTFMAGAAGALLNLVIYFDKYSLLIGASGAISGHMAGVVRLIYSTSSGFSQVWAHDLSRVKVLPLRALLAQNRAWVFILIWVLLNFVSAFVFSDMMSMGGRISWEAHIGGFIGGLVLFCLFDKKVPEQENEEAYLS